MASGPSAPLRVNPSRLRVNPSKLRVNEWREKEKREAEPSAAAARERGEKSRRGRTEKEGKGHADAVGVEPVDGRAPDARGEGHGAVHLVNGAKSESASDFDLRASVVALEQSGVSRIHPENADDGDHQDDGKRATAPGVGGDQGRLQVEGRSLNGHENPPRRK